MQIVDKRSIKSKSFTIKSIMKDPKLSKILLDCWDAPAGSTRNTKARSILKSLHKASVNYNYINPAMDGRGGSPTPQQSIGWQGNPFNQGATYGNPAPVNNTAPISTAPNQFAKSIDYLIPTDKISTENVGSTPSTVSGEPDGAMKEWLNGVIQKGITLPSGVKSWTEKKAFLPMVAKGAVKGAEGNYGVIKKLGGAGTGVVSEMGNVAGEIPNILTIGMNKILGTNFTTTPIAFAQQQKINGKTGTAEQLTPTEGDLVKTKDSNTVYLYLNGTYRPIPNEKTYRELTIQKKDSPTDWSKVKTVDKIGNVGPTVLESGKYETPTKKEEVISLLPDTTVKEDETDINVGDMLNQPTDVLSALYNSITDPSVKEMYKPYYDAAMAGESPALFSMRLMADKTMLAKALGMSPEAAAKLPDSPLLSEQINDLRNQIKISYGLDEQAKKITDLENRGYSVKQDLTDYVRGKDEYLGTVDKLMAEAYNKMKNMDTSNPYVAKRMDNYLNYLTILKGKQNQKYEDMINNSINYHTAELERAQNNYKDSLAKAENEFNSMSAVTEESYNNIKTTLESVLTSITGKTEEAQKLEDRQWERTNQQIKQAEGVLSLMEKQIEIDNGGSKVKAGSTSEYDSYIINGKTDTPESIEFLTYNPYEAMKTAQEYQKSTAPAFTRFIQLMGMKINSTLSTGDLSEFKKFKNSMDYDVAGSIQQLTEDEVAKLTPEQKTIYLENLQRVAGDYTKMQSALQSTIQSGIKSYLTDKTNDLKGCIKELIKYYSKGKVWFVKRWGDELGNDIAGALYDYTSKNVKDGMSAAEIYQGLNTSDDNTITFIISQELSEYLTF